MTALSADDMIGSLVARVRELSLRVADLEGQLEAARRRIAVYEDFDAQVSESLAAALRAANEIRQRAQVSADAIIAEARAARPAIVQELDAMRAERDALRTAIASAPRTPAAAPAATAFPMAEMRTAATEALRGVFKELVAEIRATAPVAPVAGTGSEGQTAVQTGAAGEGPAAVQTGEAVPPRPARSPAPDAAPTAAYVPPAQRPAAPTPPPPSNITVVPPVVTVVPTVPAPSVAPSPAAPSVGVAPSADAPSVTVFPSRPAIIEDLEAAASAPAPATPREEEWVPSNEAVGEIQVVLSPISSFPRLVELERRLQGMPVVRTVYARDFRNGVATLAIGLRHPMTVQEFATAVTSLEYPRLRIVSTTGFVLELRIDTEASSIA